MEDDANEFIKKISLARRGLAGGSFVIAVLSCAVFLFCQPTNTQADELASLSLPFVKPTTVNAICSFDRVAISPSGEYLSAWWSNAETPSETNFQPQGRLLVLRTACLQAASAQACLPEQLESLGALSPPNWLAGEKQFYIYDHRAGFINYAWTEANELERRDVAKFVPLPPGLIHIRGEAHLPFREWWNDQLHFLTLARLKLAGTSATLRTVAIDSSGLVGVVAESPNNLEIELYSNNQYPASLAFAYPQFKDLDLWNSSGRAIIRGIGISLSTKFSDDNTVVDVEPFSQAISNAATGELDGEFTDTRIKLKSASRIPLGYINSLEQQLRTQKGFYFSSVSVSEQSAKIVALLSDIYGNKIVSIAGEKQYRYSCNSSLPTSYPQVRYELLVVNLGDTAWPIWSHWYKGEGNRKGLVIYLHGGPAEVNLANANVDTIAHYLDLGYDVIAPEYSGSSGAGLLTATRLAKLGSTSIITDADLIGKTADDEKTSGKYPQVILHLESWSGVYFLSDNFRQKSRFSKIVMLSPFFKYRPGVASQLNNQADDKYQLAFERVVLGLGNGPGSTLQQWIVSAARSTFMTIPPTLIIRSDRDPISKLDDLEALSRVPQIKQVSEPAPHYLLRSYPDTWNQIRAFLG